MLIKNTRKLLSKKEQIEKMVALPAINLEAEEADRFITYIADQSVLKNLARIYRMNKVQKNIQGLGFGSGKMLHRGDRFDKSKVKKEFVNNRIQLTAKKVKGAVFISDDDLEDNIEQTRFKDTIMKLVAAKIGNEIEGAGYMSDINGPNNSSFDEDDIRTLWDAWRYQIQNDSNDVTGSATIKDATADFDLSGKIAEQDGSAPYGIEFKYADMLKALPSKYKRVGLNNLRFFNSDVVTQDYFELMKERNTNLGDQAILGNVPHQYGKVPIVDCPLLPLDLDASGVLGGGSYTDSILTPKGNLIVGIHRALKIESERSAFDEGTYWVYTMRLDFAIENVEAIVMTEKLTHG